MADDEMPTPEPLDAESEAFEDLVARSVELFDSGGTAAVEELLANHPNKSEQVRAALHRLHGSGLLNVHREDPFPSRLGEFELLRRIGGGGMGVVFLARQESLDRSVALKIVRPDYLYFGNAKERFRREVLAVSRLQHPGIVPIWHVGEQDDMPYFAMEFVDGCSLSEVLDRAKERHEQTGRAVERRGRALRELVLDHPTESTSKHSQTSGSQLFEGSWEQACLRITLRVAEAMCHAHEQGIVHRDLKPSNVMLTADGQVKLVDFGLATLESEEKLTKSNAVLGSLHYMSPEQVRQETVDERSDVYSLGVTLYEILCLRAPYEENDPGTLREDILHGTAESVRRRVRSVSRDTEIVVETAMASSLHRRYESMHALADDLRNLLSLRPIHACPPNVSLRATRWVQRHPMLSMALLLLVVVAASFSSLWWQQRAANQALHSEQTKVVNANADLSAANERAKTSLAAARKAIETMMTRIANSKLAVMPQVHPLRQQVLSDALRLYEELSSAEPGVAALQIDLAALECRIGYLQQQIGDYKDADTLIGRAAKRLRELVERDATDRNRYELGRTLVFLAGLRMSRRRGEEAVRTGREAIAIMEPIHEGLWRDADGDSDRAMVLANLASAYQQIDNIGVWFPKLRASEGPWSRKFGELALALRKRVFTEYPRFPQAREKLADQYRRNGSAKLTAKDHDAAIELLQLALATFAPLLDEANTTSHALNNYGLCHAGMARATLALRRRGEAKEWRRKEVAIMQRLVRDHPEFPKYSCSLGGALHNLAMLQFADREHEETDRNLDLAMDAQSRALAKIPRSKLFRGFMRNHLHMRCQLHFRLKRYEELLRDARRLPTFDTVKGRGELDAASFILHAAIGFRADAKRVESCNREAVEQLHLSKSKGFLRPEYLRADIFRALDGRSKFEALR